MRKHLVEVTDANGTVVYLSPRLRRPFPDDNIKTFHNHKIDGQNIRLAKFSGNGLTVRAGDDLKAINQIGRDIVMAMIGAIPTVLLLTLIGSAWVASKAIAPVDEIRHAASRISAQRLDQRLPVPPTKDEVYTEMEALIQHFLLYSQGFLVPAGEAYVPVEGPRGEHGCYVVSDGTNRPWRVKMRSPSLMSCQALPKMIVGGLIADVIAVIGSIDVVMGDVDR